MKINSKIEKHKYNTNEWMTLHIELVIESEKKEYYLQEQEYNDSLAQNGDHIKPTNKWNS